MLLIIDKKKKIRASEAIEDKNEERHIFGILRLFRAKTLWDKKNPAFRSGKI